MLNRQRIAAIVGCGLNAVGVAEGLRACGWDGRIVFLKEEDESPAYLRLMPETEWKTLSLRTPEDLPDVLEGMVSSGAALTLFLTDERFHVALSRARACGSLSRVRCFLGVEKDLDRVLDRLRFCAFLEENGLSAVPRTLAGSADPWAAFGGPFLFRFRYSWIGLQKLDRVQLVRSRPEWDRLKALYRAEGFNDDDWCYQEYLSQKTTDNVSVCGWHDKETQHYAVTRAVLRCPRLRGTAVVCEQVEGFEELAVRTALILAAMDFEGPFELEFVRDARSGVYKAIELNPRFWLQHILVQNRDGFRITRKYLGEGAVAPERREWIRWVSTTHAIRRAAMGDLRALPFLLMPRSLTVPKLWPAARVLARELWSRTRLPAQGRA